MNPDVKIIGEYKNTQEKIKVKCNTCGYEWDANYYRLIHGKGCKKCSIRLRNMKYPKPIKKTHEEFLNQLCDVNSSIKINSEYKTAVTPVECECTLCGNKWYARPSNLLSGYGCPECAKKRISFKQIRENSDFVSELKNINPKIVALERYRGNKVPIRCMCTDCGHVWAAMPSNLIRNGVSGTGCPRCRRSHGEKYISDWLIEKGVSFTTQVKFDDLTGVGGGKLSYDFLITEHNLLLEYQGEFHDHSVRSMQSDEDYAIQIEHDKRKREYAESHGFKFYEIWYYDHIEDKLNKIIA